MSCRHHGPLKGARRDGADAARGRPQFVRPREGPAVFVTASPDAAAPAPARPTFLTVVSDRSAVDHLPAAAARARKAGARLLIIALAMPRTGFTTDPVILRHAAVHAQEEMSRLQQVSHQLLRDCGVDYNIVAMPYRGSRAPAKRERRIAAAMSRLARVRGATALPTQAMSDAGQRAAPGRASAGRPAHVVAVLPDSAEAVRVARTAGELALATHLPLALVVPVPALGNIYDPEEMARGYTRIGEDMAAIAGRVQPVLDLLGIPARVFSAPYRIDMTASSSHPNMAVAVESAARRLRSPAVVVSAAFPALAHLRLPAEVLQVVELPTRRSSTPQGTY